MHTRILSLVLVLLTGCGDDDMPTCECGSCPCPVTCIACGGDCEASSTVVADRNHTNDPVSYDDNPPMGGPHSPCWAEWGVHETEVPAENWIHNLEHGGVVVLYDCPTGCAQDVATLSDWVESLGNAALLSPASSLSMPFAIVAWEHRLLSSCVDLTAMNLFFVEHGNRAPETVTAPPPASCL